MIRVQCYVSKERCIGTWMQCLKKSKGFCVGSHKEVSSKDIFVCIASKLDAPDILRFSQLGQWFREVAQRNDLWQKAFLLRLGVREDVAIAPVGFTWRELYRLNFGPGAPKHVHVGNDRYTFEIAELYEHEKNIDQVLTYFERRGSSLLSEQ
ncbi:hypothetical protein OROMI_001779 [Orobanche minor]